eukprot:403342194
MNLLDDPDLQSSMQSITDQSISMDQSVFLQEGQSLDVSKIVSKEQENDQVLLDQSLIQVEEEKKRVSNVFSLAQRSEIKQRDSIVEGDNDQIPREVVDLFFGISSSQQAGQHDLSILNDAVINQENSQVEIQNDANQTQVIGQDQTINTSINIDEQIAQAAGYESDVVEWIQPKQETFMQKKLKEYEELMHKEFGTASIDWKPKLSKLEQAKANAINNRNESKSKTRDSQLKHLEAWGMKDSNGGVPSLTSLLSSSKQKMTKLEEEKAQAKQTQQQRSLTSMPGQLNQQRVSLASRLSGQSNQSYQSTFMGDALKKQSKLEAEQLNSKKRIYSEITESDPTDNFPDNKDHKRLKQNPMESTPSFGFMSDVVKKKSRLELEKEAALKAKMEEKENLLRNINQRGIVMKLDTNEQPLRQSKSPRGHFTKNPFSRQTSSQRQSIQSNGMPPKKEDLKPLREINDFQNSVVHEVDPLLEQTMLK